MRHFVLRALAVGLLLPGLAAAETCPDPLAAAPQLTAESLDLDALRGFYHESSPCLWSDEAAAALQAAVARLGEDGLDPEQFHATALARHAAPADAAAAAERDLLSTDAALAYARAMVEGRVDPAVLSDQIDLPRPAFDPAEKLHLALEQGAVAAWLAQLPPPDPQYAALKLALARYRGLAEWAALPVPGGKAIDPGQPNPVIPQVKQRLVAEAELAKADDGEALEGAALAAFEHFQRRHGLTADGRLGKQSFVALNVPLAERIGQIVATLERRREIARLLPPTRIEVNVASATVTLLRDGEPVSGMRAVVGDATHQTPMLLSSIRDVEINPPWIVPVSIIRKEIEPRLRRDPDYLARENMSWAEGQLIQAPGPRNSLGRLKFEFANPFSIYLHDTPLHSLFALDLRALSHGCVRLEHPLDLAQTLLADSTPDPITRAIATGVTSRMRLPEAMPVAVLYWSVFVEADGTVDFRDDVYRRDARLLAALQAPAREAGAGPARCGGPGPCRNT